MNNPARSRITLLVSTWDGFADCWDPFFTLLKKFWPNCPYPIALTTEQRGYAFPGLEITPCRVNRHQPGRLTWSQVNLLALTNCISSELVLFMLDDFFINGPVDQTTIEQCADLMEEHGYSCVTLTNHDQRRVHHPTNDPLLNRIDQHSPYRVTTSPALWRRDALRRYLKPEENAWMFEKLGTWRSQRLPDTFFRVNEGAISPGHHDVIPYFWTREGDTGIIKGKWQRDIRELFDSTGIQINYSSRGFFRKLPWLLNKIYLIQKMANNPKTIISAILDRF